MIASAAPYSRCLFFLPGPSCLAWMRLPAPSSAAALMGGEWPD